MEGSAPYDPAGALRPSALNRIGLSIPFAALPLDIPIHPQPDDVTCGPTSLHAVYSYFDYEIALREVIDSVNYLEEGGTLAVFLGIDALRRGFSATLYTYNLHVFDPSWATLDPGAMQAKLVGQLAYKKALRIEAATGAYCQFLEQGGRLRLFEELTPDLLAGYFDQEIPVLAGLSATYLYNTRREYLDPKSRSVFDDMRGEPVGHFVVLSGFTSGGVLVSDPFKENPISGDHRYVAPTERLLDAILLGIATYDANLLIIAPPQSSR
jgi:hypothetical protein